MKEVYTIHKFLELRAQGKSFRAIESEIGTNRGTLAKWQREYKEELKNLKAIELDAMREKYLLTTQAQLELLGAQFMRLKEELEKRDLSEIPTTKLFDLVLKYSTKLKEDFPEARISTEEELAEDKAERERNDFLMRSLSPMTSLPSHNLLRGSVDMAKQ